tara:strand:- start:320 stop:694 length:375 start_codon:yes stop_codon:yes gene_type:complete
MKGQWIPEIMYEEAEDGITSRIPFIQVPIGEKMPNTLFVFESKDTGEFEPGPNGEELAVTELDLHQYADMITLRKRLPPHVYNQVRLSLGLQPLEESSAQRSEDVKDQVIEKVTNIIAKKNNII